jgi:hypothetical protein
VHAFILIEVYLLQNNEQEFTLLLLIVFYDAGDVCAAAQPFDLEKGE